LGRPFSGRKAIFQEGTVICIPRKNWVLAERNREMRQYHILLIRSWEYPVDSQYWTQWELMEDVSEDEDADENFKPL
jgi:hypothetical protein